MSGWIQATMQQNTISYSVARQIWLTSLNENPDSMAKKGGLWQ